MARPHSDAVEFSLANKGMLQVMMVLTAGVLVVAASPTANEPSFQWLLSTLAASTTSENYLLASTMSSSYGLTWPNNYGPSIRFGDPSGEIEQEAVWAKPDVADRVKLGLFENVEFIKVFSDETSYSRASRDTLACVGYVSCSKPLHRYPRYSEYSMAWI